MRWGLALLALALTLTACGTAEDPAAVSLRLFELARIDEPSDEQLGTTFDPALAADGRAALLDALSTLAHLSSPQVVDLHQPAGPDDAFADLVAELHGGGTAHFTVRLRRGGDETDPWRVTWFQGPGVEWPATRSKRGAGLTTSTN